MYLENNRYKWYRNNRWYKRYRHNRECKWYRNYNYNIVHSEHKDNMFYCSADFAHCLQSHNIRSIQYRLFKTYSYISKWNVTINNWRIVKKKHIQQHRTIISNSHASWVFDVISIWTPTVTHDAVQAYNTACVRIRLIDSCWSDRAQRSEMRICPWDSRGLISRIYPWNSTLRSVNGLRCMQ